MNEEIKKIIKGMVIYFLIDISLILIFEKDIIYLISYILRKLIF